MGAANSVPKNGALSFVAFNTRLGTRFLRSMTTDPTPQELGTRFQDFRQHVEARRRFIPTRARVHELHEVEATISQSEADTPRYPTRRKLHGNQSSCARMGISMKRQLLKMALGCQEVRGNKVGENTKTIQDTVHIVPRCR